MFDYIVTFLAFFLPLCIVVYITVTQSLWEAEEKPHWKSRALGAGLLPFTLSLNVASLWEDASTSSVVSGNGSAEGYLLAVSIFIYLIVLVGFSYVSLISDNA
ncbi:hypothetical protein GCM10009006_36630 [Haloarcula argentinensis]|uniref:Uncharacterized protein n=1 Tax=Haloarcula argentinensis TaxID=43776 RepID=A0A830FRY6_HALAR|nr:hypothetical protein GCM10009006_36630 [Haloarcula argentinensis]